MVNNRSMVAQQDHINGVDRLETSVSNGARPPTLMVDTLERKIQGIMTNVQLLME